MNSQPLKYSLDLNNEDPVEEFEFPEVEEMGSIVDSKTKKPIVDLAETESEEEGPYSPLPSPILVWEFPKPQEKKPLKFEFGDYVPDRPKRTIKQTRFLNPATPGPSYDKEEKKPRRTPKPTPYKRPDTGILMPVKLRYKNNKVY